ncbi:MAG: nuclear transport factor 2 family protein [Dehalococcoidia bacterium]
MTDAREELLAANDAFYAAFNAHDFEAMEQVWAESVTCICVHPGWMTLATREAVLASWAAILGNAAQPRVVPGSPLVTINGDTGVVHCREFVAGSAIVATNIFVREGDRWRLAVHHGSGVARMPG